MMDSALQILTAVACLIVIVRADRAANNMDNHTDTLVRYAFILLAASAAAGIVAIGLGYVPGWREPLMSGGIAALMLAERRIRLLSTPTDRSAIQ
jgi:hypothetical protein